MPEKFIGVFDSGLGGLTCVKELMEILPYESIVYFGDTGRVPYGSKSNETIIKYARSDIKFLKEFDLKMIVVACGTASAIALPVIKDEVKMPIIGVVSSAACAAVSTTKNKKIGIIGTQGSIRSGAYEKEIAKLDESIKTYATACPMFVPIVENGYAKSEVARIIAKEYLTDIKMAGVDTLILGCTHYPLLKEVIAEVMGEGVTLIDPGKISASYVKDYLSEQGFLSDGTPEHKFYVSDTPEGFRELASEFLNREISENIEKINIEEYM